MNERLKNLGAEVARTQDELLADPRHRDAVRRRLANEPVPSRRASGSRAWRPWAGALGAVAVAAALLLVWTREPETIRFSVGGGDASTDVDEPITAAEGQALSVAFSDDSWVRLAPGARARVAELTSVGALVDLEQGEATVYVRARAGTRWSVRAGPFLVEVTGTTFRVAWRPSSESFTLSVFEGEVQVSGPGIGTRTARGGDQVDASLKSEPTPTVAPSAPDPVVAPPPPTPAPRVAPPPPTPAPRVAPPRIPPRSPEKTREHRPTREPARVEPAPAPKPASGDTKADEAAEEPAGAPPATAIEPSETQPSAPPTPAVAPPATQDPVEAPEPPREPPTAKEKPEWIKLIEQGDYQEALSSVSPSQFEQAIQQSERRELVGLAAAARRLGDPRARRIYRAIRSRFPNSDAAAQAAFILARIDFHDGSFQAASAWLETYLRERPKGRFARDASGRLIEAYRRAGDDKGARVAAKQYLARYPDGPHAELARSVLR